MENDSSEVSVCPSFNSYTDEKKLVDIAARVSRDYKSNDVLDDEEFEFFSLWENSETSSFPIFNRDLLLNGREEAGEDGDAEEAIRIPLRNLFIGDGDLPSSSSDEEADELEGVPSGTYCVWRPRQPAESPLNRCKKSMSTGSCSKRWRLKDLLKRSNSDGKVSSSSSFMFLNFEKNSTEKKHEEKLSAKTATAKKKSEGEVQAKKIKKVEKVSAHEAFYVRTKALKEGDKRRSYLPYRQDLFGIFGNFNGLGRTFTPF